MMQRYFYEFDFDFRFWVQYEGVLDMMYLLFRGRWVFLISVFPKITHSWLLRVAEW